MKDRSGMIWVATILDGLYRIDPVTDSVEHFVHDRTDPNSLSSDRTNNLYEDPSGRVWFGAVNVINRWNPDESDVHAISQSGISERRIPRVSSDQTGKAGCGYRTATDSWRCSTLPAVSS